MKVYTLRRKQFLPIGLPEAWGFFSKPENLGQITPGYMKFRIIHVSGDGNMFSGQIIRYQLYVFPFIPWKWTTRITDVEEPHSFVDEQLSGPYAFWRHRHQFVSTDRGVEVSDEVDYAIPFGFVGRIVNRLLIRRQLNRIFDYRYVVLARLFTGTRNENSIT